MRPQRDAVICSVRRAQGSPAHMQELEDYMAKGITGTGEGFHAPPVGRLGGSGFGAHNPSPSELRSKMVQVSRDASILVRTHHTALMLLPCQAVM